MSRPLRVWLPAWVAVLVGVTAGCSQPPKTMNWFEQPSTMNVLRQSSPPLGFLRQSPRGLDFFGQPPPALVLFEQPRVFVHVRQSPKDVRLRLRGEGLSTAHRDEYIVVRGTGRAELNGLRVEVLPNALLLNGVVIASRDEEYRNVVLTPAGKVQQDHFTPQERPFP